MQKPRFYYVAIGVAICCMTNFLTNQRIGTAIACILYNMMSNINISDYTNYHPYQNTKMICTTIYSCIDILYFFNLFTY